MTAPQVLLVAGFDYHGGGTNFGRKCDNRRQYLQRRRELSGAAFWKYDFAMGEISVDAPEFRPRKWRLLARRDPVSMKSYKDHRLDPNLHTLSMIDVYTHVVGSEAGSILEISVFSHAFARGPILLDTYDKTPTWDKPFGKRDPSDKDGRLKDFGPEEMPPDKLKKFRAAFGSNPTLWIWGCDGESRCWEVYQELRKSPAWKKVPSGKHDPGLRVRLTFERGRVALWHSDDPQLFPDVGGTPEENKKPYSWEVTLGEIAASFRRGMDNVYMARLATAARSPSVGALPGTTAVFEARDGLMEIAHNRATQHDDFTGLVKFYCDHAGVRTDAEGRMYGIFNPSPK
jgi:hypothetical protein